MKDGPGGAVTLPRWVQMFFLGVAEAPWTNLKSMNGEILTYLTAAFLAVAAVFQLKLEENILYAWLAYLAGKVGFAMGGAAIKRATYKPAPPHGPDIEDAQAGATTTEEHPAVPKGGVKPKDPKVVAGFEAIADAQRDSRLPSPLDDERD